MKICILLLASMAPMFTAELKSGNVKSGNVKWVDDLGGSVIRNPRGDVTAVSLRGTWVSDTDLRRLSDLPALVTLDLSLTRITDQGMQEIRDLRGIEDFSLRFSEYVTDEGIAAIKDWKRLKRLNLHGTKVGDTGLEHIAGITPLESLDVGSTLMTDVGLERLTTLPNLRRLTMGGNELGDAGLQALRQMPALMYLDLSGRQGTDKNVWTIAMSDAGLEAVLTLKQLRELRFGCSSIGVGIEGAKFAEISLLSVTPKWLERMQSLTRLERLKLQGCNRINDGVVSSLLAMPALREVDLQGTGVSEKGAAALKSARSGMLVYFGPWEGKSANYRNN